MASRKARAEAAEKQKGKPDVQIDDHAFNVFGWCLEIPDTKTSFMGGPVIINAYTPIGTEWAAAIKVLENTKSGSAWRTSLDLTTREATIDTEAGVCRYLVVGFAIYQDDAAHAKMVKTAKKQQGVGTHVHSENLIKPENIPLLVVTQLQEVEQVKVDLYVLLNPKHGLCTPYHIGHKYCYYLPLYRDGSTVLKERGPAWNTLAAKQALRPSESEPSAKQKAYRKARNTSKIVLEPRLSLQNEICCLAECYAKTGEMWHLKELATVLENADGDLIYEPAATNEGLRAFVDLEVTFTEEDSTKMVDELRQLWPELGEIGAPDIVTLRKQLAEAEIILEYRLLRPFIAEASFQLKKLKASHADVSHVVKDAIETVRRVLGSNKSAVPMLEAGDENRILECVNKSLKAIVQTGATFEKGMKENCGDQTMKGTLHDVWEEYADCLDTDAAKKCWFEAMRYMTAAQKHKQRGLAGMVEDVVQVLDEMNINK